MRKHKKFRSRLALLLCAALLCAGPVSPVRAYASVDDEGEVVNEDYDDVIEVEDDVDEPTAASSSTGNSKVDEIQDKISQYSSQLKNIQAAQKEIEADIASARDEKAQAEAERNKIGDKIYLKETEIQTLAQKIAAHEESIALLEADIEERQKDIKRKQGEIDYNYNLFKQRVRAKYMQDNGSSLGLLLGVDSFSEFLTRSEYMGRIAQHDQDLMALLTEERIAIEQDKELLELTKTGVEEEKGQVELDKSATESIKKELQVDYSVAQQQVHSAEAMEQAFMADLEKNKAMQSKMKAEIDQLYRELEFSKNPYAGGSMAWPVPGFYTISSYYGSRFGGSDYHTGNDITGSGVYGANIVAANDGTVAFTNIAYSQGVGYGIYLILDHGVNDKGQSVSTLYAHCSQLLASTGQQVKKGDIIAKVGSTGWSTGPHLHFEVRLDGKHVDSLPYIKG